MHQRRHPGSRIHTKAAAAATKNQVALCVSRQPAAAAEKSAGCPREMARTIRRTSATAMPSATGYTA